MSRTQRSTVEQQSNHSGASGVSDADIGELFCDCDSLVRMNDWGEDSRTKLYCPNCSTKHRSLAERDAEFEVVEEQKEPHDPWAHVDSDDDEEFDPRVTVEAVCPECDEAVEARAQMQQNRAADEAPTRLLECPDCGHSWRADD